MSWAQIATIPMNSVSDANAAASSTKTFSITDSFTLNIARTLFCFCSLVKGAHGSPGERSLSLVNLTWEAGEAERDGR
jgi:hypothetical protein